MKSLESNLGQDPMPSLIIPNSACLHTFKSFLDANSPFSDEISPATLEFHPRWAHMDPMALAMAAAWGGWCLRKGLSVLVKNGHGAHAHYAERMRLFAHLGVPLASVMKEREEAGRFMQITQVRTPGELSQVIGNVSALLHLAGR